MCHQSPKQYIEIWHERSFSLQVGEPRPRAGAMMGMLAPARARMDEDGRVVCLRFFSIVFVILLVNFCVMGIKSILYICCE